MADEAVLERLLPGDALAEDGQFQRPLVADSAGESREGVPAQRNAQLHLRDGEPCAGSGDAEIAARGEHSATADGVAVDGSDGDLVEVLDGRRGPAADAGLVAQLQLVIGARSAPLARVCARRERGARTCEDDGPRLKIVGQPATDLLDIQVHLVVDRVALFGTVHAHGHDGPVLLNG